MRRYRRTTIFGIVFWTLFLASAALSVRYRWLDTAWLFACILFGIIASVFSIVEMFRNHRVSGEYIYHRGVPRWMRRYLVDDEQHSNDLQTRKIADAKRARSSPR